MRADRLELALAREAPGFGARLLDRWRRFLDGDLWHSFKRSPITIVAFIVTVALFAVALLAPWLAPHNTYDLASLNLLDAFRPPAWATGGDAAFPLGTDDQGRDVLSSIMFGLRISLLVGFAAVVLAAVVGTLLGLLSGYLGGLLDSFIMRVADIQLTFPAILIALLIDGIARSVLPAAVAPRLQAHRPDPRDRRLAVGQLRAHRARLDDGREEQGVRPGRQGDRHPPAADHAAPRAAQRDGAGTGDRARSRSRSRS